MCSYLNNDHVRRRKRVMPSLKTRILPLLVIDQLAYPGANGLPGIVIFERMS